MAEEVKKKKVVKASEGAPEEAKKTVKKAEEKTEEVKAAAKKVEKADEEGYEWDDPLRFSKAAQEVFADIAERRGAK